MDTHTRERGLPTTQKAVANAILKPQIENYPNGCRYMFLENIYKSPHLLEFMTSEWNIRAVGAFRENRIGFDSEALNLDSKIERGSFSWLVEKQLGMVI